MSSGDALLALPALSGIPPTSNGATPNRRNSHPIFEYDAATDESLDFDGLVLPAQYGGGGLTVSIRWLAATATTGNVVWNAQIERQNDDAVDLDADSFAAAQAVTAGAPSASGEVGYDSITFTSGAQMDNLAAEENFRLRITRDADNASDTMAGDAQLLAVYVTET